MIISDSSPLIALAKIGRFELLRDLFKDIYITKAVHREVVVSGKRSCIVCLLRSQLGRSRFR